MIQIIPAIDLLNGRCVRLKKGDFNLKTEYSEDPLDMAMRFEDHGITRLHLVDLDGARAKRLVNYHILEKIALKTSLVIDFGGGIRTNKDVETAFNSGANMITGGSIAVKNRDLFLGWIQKYGEDKIILGADFLDDKIAVSGWKEHTEIKLLGFLNDYHDMGINKAICTDISKDGMLEGPSFITYSIIKAAIPDLKLIASGGISMMSDVERLHVEGYFGVIIGKAIYEGRIALEELKHYIIENE